MAQNVDVTPAPAETTSTTTHPAAATSSLFTASTSNNRNTQIPVAQLRLAISKLLQRNDNNQEVSPGSLLLGAWQASAAYPFSQSSSHNENDASAPLASLASQFPMLSQTDLITYAGVVAVELCGGPTIPYAFGRIDKVDTHDDDNNLTTTAAIAAASSKGQDLRRIFAKVGITSDQEIVALMGAHGLGRKHEIRSGYWGPWTTATETNNTTGNSFGNSYFQSLLRHSWTPKLSHNGTAWRGPELYEDTSTGALTMMPIDLALLQDAEFRRWVVIYAYDQDRFFQDFAKVFSKLLHLGTPLTPGKAWYKLW